MLAGLQPHRDLVLVQVGLEVLDGVFGVVENRCRQGCVRSTGPEDVDEVIEELLSRPFRNET